jgi:hypothetical protein
MGARPILAILSCFALRAVAAPSVSSELDLSTAVPGSFLADHTNDPAQVAFDGTNYWVVWDDNSVGTQQVFAARVSTAGLLLDSVPMRLAPSSGLETAPSIACATTLGICLVAWEDYRFGDADIYGVRVGSTGVLDAAPLVINAAAGDQQVPKMATDQTNFFIVWEDQGSFSAVGSLMTASTGQVLNPVGTALSTLGANSAFPTVTFLQGEYLVAAIGGGFPFPVSAARFNGLGAPIGSAITVTTQSADDPLSSTDGANFWVSWLDTAEHIRASRITPDGGLLDPSGIQVTSDVTSKGPTIAFPMTSAPTEGWLAWEDANVVAARVNADSGTAIDATPIQVSSNWVQSPPSLDCSGATCLISFIQGTGAGNQIVGRRVASSGAVLDSSDLVFTPPESVAPWESSVASACNSVQCLAAYRRSSGPATTIYATRLWLDGGVLDPAGIAIASPNYFESLAVSAAPSAFLVSWTDMLTGPNGLVFAARVTLDGGVLDPGGITVRSNPTSIIIDVASTFDGVNHVLAWTEETSTWTVHAAHVSLGGTVSAGVTVSNDGNIQASAALSGGGGQALVAWIDDPASTPETVSANVFFSDGGLLGPAGFRVSQPMHNKYNALYQRAGIAQGNGEYLVVWPERPPDGGSGAAGGFDLYGARVAFDAGVLGSVPFPVTRAAGNQNLPVAAFDGTTFYVAWTDGRAGPAQVFGAHLDLDGGILDSDFAISPQPDSQVGSMCSVGGGGILLTYQRFDPSAGIENVRARARLLGLGAPCPGSPPCASSVCSGGTWSSCDGGTSCIPFVNCPAGTDGGSGPLGLSPFDLSVGCACRTSPATGAFAALTLLLALAIWKLRR